MWAYHNPVAVEFGCGGFAKLPRLIGGRRYGIVTYPDALFSELTASLIAAAGEPAIVINDVAPNPDFQRLHVQTARFAPVAHDLQVIVALGGGSAIDSSKVIAAANGDFLRVKRFLETKQGSDDLSSIPIIAVPTTAGTGSEVTSWATVWDAQEGRKYSLARPDLYPETALIDPELMVGKPQALTVSTGLDALSHALESIWNVNANPVSCRHAVAAARSILAHLPALQNDLTNLELRTHIAEAALFAGLAFSNTKTAIAHNISYPITLGWGIPHGIACSFTLPIILRSVDGIGGIREASLKAIFGPDLTEGSDRLASFLTGLGVGIGFADYDIPDGKACTIVDDAFAGERGQNFIGSKDSFLTAKREFEEATMR